MRLEEEITDLKNHLLSLGDYLMEQVRSFDLKSIQKFQMSAYQEMKYGLRKYIIAVTQRDTVLAIDTKTRAILWK